MLAHRHFLHTFVGGVDERRAHTEYNLIIFRVYDTLPVENDGDGDTDESDCKYGAYVYRYKCSVDDEKANDAGDMRKRANEIQRMFFHARILVEKHNNILVYICNMCVAAKTMTK